MFRLCFQWLFSLKFVTQQHENNTNDQQTAIIHNKCNNDNNANVNSLLFFLFVAVSLLFICYLQSLLTEQLSQCLPKKTQRCFRDRNERNTLPRSVCTPKNSRFINKSPASPERPISAQFFQSHFKWTIIGRARLRVQLSADCVCVSFLDNGVSLIEY